MARPYVVKPTDEGSSVGVRIVRQGDNLPPLGSSGWHFGDDVLVERYIPGRELTVAVMGGDALAVTELGPMPASTTTRPNTPTARPSISCRRRCRHAVDEAAKHMARGAPMPRSAAAA